MINYYLHSFHWDQFDLYKDEIINYCLSREKPGIVELNISSHCKHNLWESDFQFLESNVAGITALKLWIIDVCEQYLHQLNEVYYKFIIKESWAHVTRENGYHMPHSHCHSTWSGIIYIDGDNNGGKTHFIPPLHIERKPGLEFIKDDFYIRPIPGMMVLFPSALTHYVEPYLGSTPRITIAFNALCF